MTVLERAKAMWTAFPAAPETRRLRFLRWQFIIATFATAALLLRLDGLWEPHRGITVLVGPMGVFVLLAGNRYFRAKQAADLAHRDALIDSSSSRGEDR